MKDTLLSWIKELVSKYQIDGLRIDTIPEVPKWFWSEFSHAAGVYTLGEVLDGGMSYVGGYVGSIDAILNYPFFFTMRDVLFNQKDMNAIKTYYFDWLKHLDIAKQSYLGNFCDNHDNPRSLSQPGDW